MKPNLSIFIITHNEQTNIRRCLDSLKHRFTAMRLLEVLVVDAQSTDRTTAVARRWGARVVVRPWRGFSDQKNWALDRCRGDWILSLDADEEMTEELWREVERVVPEAPEDLAGYFIPRRAYFLGKWIKHCGWWPDSQLRLLRRGRGRFNSNPVHEGIETRGRTRTLQEPMNHQTYVSISHYLQKMDAYSALAVERPPAKKVKWWPYYLLINPGVVFFRMYWVRKGFLDGWHGFLVCGLSMFHEFVKYAKLWERHILPSRGGALDAKTNR